MMISQETDSDYSILDSTDLRMLKGEMPMDIIPGFISRGLNLIAGPPKSLKTTFALQVAETLCKSGEHILFVSPDEGLIGSRQKFINMAIDDCGNARFLDLANFPTFSLEILKNILEKNTETSIVVIDTLHSAFPGKFKANYSTQVAEMKLLANVCDNFGVSMIVVLHTTKKGNGKADKPDFSSVYGTHAMTGSVVNTLIMAKDADSERIYAHRQGRFCADASHRLRYNAETYRLEYDRTDQIELLDGNLKKVYMALQKNAGPAQLSAIADVVGMKVNYLSSIFVQMTERRLVRKVSRGVYEIIQNAKPEGPVSDFLAAKKTSSVVKPDEFAEEDFLGENDEKPDDSEKKFSQDENHDEIGENDILTENSEKSFQEFNSHDFGEYQQVGEIMNFGVITEHTVFEHVSYEYFSDCYYE